MDSEIWVAIVGTGYMAREHARAFRGLDGVRLAGVFGRTRERAQALASEFGIAEICNSIDDLYARSRADLVIVAVSELAMSDLAQRCFTRPWTVLLEKPAGYNLRDAEEILSAARSAHARVYVGLNRRSYASTRRALESIDAGGGGARLISIQDQQDLSAAAALGTPAEVLRNYMFANSIHLIDYFRVFGRGAARSVQHVVPWNPQRPGFVVAHLEFESGDIGTYHGVWDGPGPWAVAVTSPQLRVEMRPLESLVLQRRGERRLVTVDLDCIDSEYKPGLRVQALRVVAALRGENSVGLATLEDATESMRLCARLYGMYA